MIENIACILFQGIISFFLLTHFIFFFLLHLSLWRRCEKDTKILVIFPVNTFIDSVPPTRFQSTKRVRWLFNVNSFLVVQLAVLYNWIGNVFGDLCFRVVSLTIYIGNKVDFFFFNIHSWNENSFLITNFDK